MQSWWILRYLKNDLTDPKRLNSSMYITPYLRITVHRPAHVNTLFIKSDLSKAHTYRVVWLYIYSAIFGTSCQLLFPVTRVNTMNNELIYEIKIYRLLYYRNQTHSRAVTTVLFLQAKTCFHNWVPVGFSAQTRFHDATHILIQDSQHVFHMCSS